MESPAERNAQCIASDIWGYRSENIATLGDIKWYVAEEASNHGMDEYTADRVTAILAERIAR